MPDHQHRFNMGCLAAYGNLDQSKVEKSVLIFTIWARKPVLKVSWFAEDQIAFAIKRAELGTRVDEIYRKMEIGNAAFYK